MQKLPASAPVMSQIPQSFKSTCDAAAKSHSFTAATRLDWCTAFGTVQTVLMNEKPIGTATVDQVDYASWKVSSRRWNDAVQVFTEVDSTGELIGEPVGVTAVSTCRAGCRITSGHTFTLVVPETPAVATEKVGVTSPGTATVTSRLKTTWAYTAMEIPAVPTLDSTTVGVRCDSQPGYRYPAGCANPSFTPTYVLSSARYPSIAKFDKAQLARHPRLRTLTRATPQQTGANRKAACKGFKPRNRNDSCDEYPYASTVQGGHGAAQEHVNKRENKAQGGNLVGFYNANRLHYGEKFHIEVR